MQVKDLIKQLQQLSKDTDRVVISVFNPGAIGSSPVVPLRAVHAGFDWDEDRCLLEPDVPLEAVGPEQAAARRKAITDSSSRLLAQTVQQRLSDLLETQKSGSDWDAAIRKLLSDLRHGLVR